MTKNTICRHSKTEVFEDADGRGYFAECLICGGAGPLRKKSPTARSALLKLKIERPTNAGGVREGAGRKKTLPDDAKFCGITLFLKHLRKIERFNKKFNKENPKKAPLKSRSAGIRKILDQLKI